MTQWTTVCTVDDAAPDDVMRFGHGGMTDAILRDPGGVNLKTYPVRVSGRRVEIGLSGEG